MNETMRLVKDYYLQNRFLLLLYGMFTGVFYSVNYVYFSESIDLPADIILIFLYIVFSPGVITLITIAKSRVDLMDSNKLYYYNILIHSIMVLVINAVALGIYAVFRVHKGYWESIYFALIIAIPFMLVGMALAFEYKLRFENLGYRILGVMGYIVSWYVLEMLFNKINHWPYVMWGVYAVYFVIVPVFIITYWYRKKLTD